MYQRQVFLHILASGRVIEVIENLQTLTYHRFGLSKLYMILLMDGVSPILLTIQVSASSIISTLPNLGPNVTGNALREFSFPTGFDACLKFDVTGDIT